MHLPEDIAVKNLANHGQKEAWFLTFELFNFVGT